LNYVTDAAGEYTFRNLPPGIYDLTVNASSFETFVRKGIELAVNQNARIPVSLTVGNASQTVTVTADASLDHLRRSPLLSDGCNLFAWRDHRGRRQCL